MNKQNNEKNNTGFITLYGFQLLEKTTTGLKETRNFESLKQKRNINETQKSITLLLTTRYWTLCRSNVLVETVRFDSIVNIIY